MEKTGRNHGTWPRFENEFEKRVNATGLVVSASPRGSYSFFKANNPDVGIEAVLKENGLAFEPYGSLGYEADIVKAVKKAAEEGPGTRFDNNYFPSIH